MNDIQKYLLDCALQNMNEKAGELIAVGGNGNFDSTLSPVEVATSLVEFKIFFRNVAASHTSQVKTNVKYFSDF